MTIVLENTKYWRWHYLILPWFPKPLKNINNLVTAALQKVTINQLLSFQFLKFEETMTILIKNEDN